MKPKDAINDGTLNLTCMVPSSAPAKAPKAKETNRARIAAFTGEPMAGPRVFIIATVSTLDTEQAAPMERSMDPNNNMAVIPDAMMIRGAESLSSVFKFACPRNLGCSTVKPMTKMIIAEKLKYRMMLS
jgi:hypothetical protein